jgi:hypothetical protein
MASSSYDVVPRNGSWLVQRQSENRSDHDARSFATEAEAIAYAREDAARRGDGMIIVYSAAGEIQAEYDTAVGIVDQQVTGC